MGAAVISKEELVQNVLENDGSESGNRVLSVTCGHDSEIRCGRNQACMVSGVRVTGADI